MLYSTEQIFRNAQYLYSTPDYDGDPNVYRWNYFYSPVRIGKDTVGVRIAVRDMITPRESQIYNWGIKKDAPLDGAGRGKNNRIPHDVSSDASNNNIPKTPPDVKANETKDAQTEENRGTPEGFEAVGAANIGFSPKEAAIRQYGAIPEGENPVRADQLPASITGDDRVSYTARTAMEAEATPNEFAELTMFGGSYVVWCIRECAGNTFPSRWVLVTPAGIFYFSGFCLRAWFMRDFARAPLLPDSLIKSSYSAGS